MTTSRETPRRSDNFSTLDFFLNLYVVRSNLFLYPHCSPFLHYFFVFILLVFDTLRQLYICILNFGSNEKNVVNKGHICAKCLIFLDKFVAYYYGLKLPAGRAATQQTEHPEWAKMRTNLFTLNTAMNILCTFQIYRFAVSLMRPMLNNIILVFSTILCLWTSLKQTPTLDHLWETLYSNS